MYYIGYYPLFFPELRFETVMETAVHCAMTFATTFAHLLNYVSLVSYSAQLRLQRLSNPCSLVGQSLDQLRLLG